MSLFSKVTTGVGDFVNDLKTEIKQLPREFARRRKERHWKRTKRRVCWAKAFANTGSQISSLTSIYNEL